MDNKEKKSDGIVVKKWILVVVIILIAAIVLLILGNPFAKSNPDKAKVDMTPQEQIDEKNAEKTAIPSIAPPSLPPLSGNVKQILEQPDNYQNETIEISGQIISEPDNKQGLIAFEMKIEDTYYVLINYLDTGMQEAPEVNKGDYVQVTGIVANQIIIKTENELEENGAIISATSIEKIQ